MLKVLVLSVAMLAAQSAFCAAEDPPANARTGTGTDAGNKQPAPRSNSAAGASSGEDSAAENELLELVNKNRELAGVSPLRMEESLREAAREHARRMVTSEQLEHQLSGEPPLLERIAKVSATVGPTGEALKVDRAGENIANAAGASGANEVLMRSTPHRRNLLDDGFNIAGVAAIWSKGRLYVVQDFAHELPTYSAQQSGKLVGRAIDELRQQSGLPELVQAMPPNLDEAACSLAKEDGPNAHLLAAAYNNRKTIAYTESRPEVLPSGAVHMLLDPGVHQFAVGACYARNAAYPTGTYWIAILLY